MRNPLFLISSKGDVRLGYDRLVRDIEAGQASISGQDATTELYRAMVDWLSRIVRCQPQVLWQPVPESADQGRRLEPLSPEGQQALRQIDWFDPTSDLSRWRALFLDSTSRILLETSGSGGAPKRVWHTIESLTRGIRTSPRHRHSIWGLTYPTDHLAGIQVLFQALLNANPLINLYRAEPIDVHRALDEWQVSHISCTPTFLRMLLSDRQVHPQVERLTTGGERLDSHLLKPISIMFPQARLTNIYASTEVGPLLVSHDDGFVIPSALQDRVRIVDGQLWLHHSLRVDADPDPREAVESELEGFWPTGDQVELVHAQPLTIRFVSRCHEGFNVAGFRVDPVRLEAIARQHPRVTDARFYGIPNSVTEHLVACDLVCAEGQPLVEVSEWQAWFSAQVARHEVPRIVRWVPELQTTPSGKVKRQWK